MERKEERLTWADDNGHGFPQHLEASDGSGGDEEEDSIHEWRIGLGFRRIEEDEVWLEGAGSGNGNGGWVLRNWNMKMVIESGQDSRT